MTRTNRGAELAKPAIPNLSQSAHQAFKTAGKLVNSTASGRGFRPLWPQFWNPPTRGRLPDRAAQVSVSGQELARLRIPQPVRKGLAVGVQFAW
jgi:hypothetical protein